MATIGNTSDASVILFNSYPFLEIKYPIPHILKEYDKKNVRLTTSDLIDKGLNFYENISEIRMKNSETEKINSEEISELMTLLTGGVIYIGSSS